MSAKGNPLDEVRKIVKRSNEANIVVRAVGGAAIRAHAHGFEINPAVKRDLADLDMIAYSKQERQALHVFEECGYIRDRSRAYMRTLIGRSILENVDNHIVVDLFYNKLNYNHTLDLRDRLEIDILTIPLAELLLQKLQIVQINEKDVKDVILILREHALDRSDQETINVGRICDVLSHDWGFFHTVTTNLAKTNDYAKDTSSLEPPDRQDVLTKIEKLQQEIETCPKSQRWKMRAAVGTHKQWYDDVEELYAGH
jgi:hypothetical protein